MAKIELKNIAHTYDLKSEKAIYALNPFSLTFLTISIVRGPGGSPTSKVPSMSKLINIISVPDREF